MLCHSGGYARGLVCSSTIPRLEMRCLRLQTAVIFASSFVLHSNLLDLSGENCGLVVDMAESTRELVTEVLVINGCRGKDTSVSSQPREEGMFDGAIRQHCGVTKPLHGGKRLL